MNIFCLVFFCFFLFTFNINALERKIIIASTTSTYDSGLLKYLNKHFMNKHEINVQTIVQGTGQAIRTAQDGNVELLLVHHKESEIEFMKNDYGLKRFDLMYNDYVIIGPKEDLDKCQNIQNKLKNIIENNLRFISRGDDSGTHKKELELWLLFNLNPEKFSENYLSVGQGMGHTLLMANEMRAYTISDRSTWIAFKRKDNLKIICENKPPLFNQYGIILVNPKLNRNLNIKDAEIYLNWLISDRGKFLINNYKINDQQLFYFNYDK